METTPLKTYKSRIEGKNADVAIYRDRVEWSVTKAGRKRTHSAEMMPLKAVSSVTSKKDGLAFTKVVLVASGNTVEIRLSHAQADEAKGLLQRLMLGGEVPTSSYIAAREAGASPTEASAMASGVARAASPPPPPPPPAAAPPPSVPAGWHPDPMGRHELRYWDGGAWSEHVSTCGVQATDPPTPV